LRWGFMLSGMVLNSCLRLLGCWDYRCKLT
jgi:hypothetical protein